MVPQQDSAVEIVKDVGEVVTGVLWWCEKLVPNLMYLSGVTFFGTKHGGSEACDGSAIGFCSRNS